MTILLLVGWFYYRNLKQEIVAEAHKGALQNLKLIHWTLQQKKDILDQADLQSYLKQLGSEMGVRITYIAKGGNVIADSDVPLSEIGGLDNHASRPEGMAA